jgi:hypothetical protein
MVPLSITLPASSDYAAGDALEVALDGVVIAAAVELKPAGADFPETVLTTDPVGYGLHTVDLVALDALGNRSAAASIDVFVNTGPRPPANLRFEAQTGDGPLTFGFTPSKDVGA